MASSVMQIGITNKLKARASAIYEELGVDLPTAIRVFLERSVVEGAPPFAMTLPKRVYKAEEAVRAMQLLGEEVKKNGTANMTLEEINAEIAAARAERTAKECERGVITGRSMMQIQIDDELRAQASALYKELGVDLSTLIRMFLQRSVVEGGPPFAMTLPKQE